MAKRSKRLPYFRVYKDAKNEFRLQLVAGNGEIIPDGYKGRRGVMRAIELIKNSAGYAIVDETWARPVVTLPRKKKVTPAAAPRQNTLLTDADE